MTTRSTTAARATSEAFSSQPPRRRRPRDHAICFRGSRSRNGCKKTVRHRHGAEGKVGASARITDHHVRLGTHRARTIHGRPASRARTHKAQSHDFRRRRTHGHLAAKDHSFRLQGFPQRRLELPDVRRALLRHVWPEPAGRRGEAPPACLPRWSLVPETVSVGLTRRSPAVT